MKDDKILYDTSDTKVVGIIPPSTAVLGIGHCLFKNSVSSWKDKVQKEILGDDEREAS